MLPSASIGARKPSGVWVGLYEPVHGSAPDIAGQNKANPLGAIGSVAAMLEYSFGLIEEAKAVNAAVEAVLNSGKVTADLKPAGKPATTEQVGKAVADLLVIEQSRARQQADKPQNRARKQAAPSEKL
jgi:3-isopropylmalate dehydrogenase